MFLPEFESETLHYILNSLIYIGLFLLAQWFFLRPRRRFQFRREDLARPMASRKIAADFIAMVLSTSLIAVLLELPNGWKEIYDGPYGIISVWIAMGLIWLVWTMVFFVYWKQADGYNRMGKIIRALLAGSLLNVFLSAWVFIKNPHEEDCYCARGSYTGLVLLFLREKNRRETVIESSDT